MLSYLFICRIMKLLYIVNKFLFTGKTVYFCLKCMYASSFKFYLSSICLSVIYLYVSYSLPVKFRIELQDINLFSSNSYPVHWPQNIYGSCWVPIWTESRSAPVSIKPYLLTFESLKTWDICFISSSIRHSK